MFIDHWMLGSELRDRAWRARSPEFGVCRKAQRLGPGELGGCLEDFPVASWELRGWVRRAGSSEVGSGELGAQRLGLCCSMLSWSCLGPVLFLTVLSRISV